MWTIALSEWKRLIRMKSVLSILILAPLVLIFILGSALSDVFQPEDMEMESIQLAYYDAGSGEISQGIEQFFAGLEKNELLIAKQSPSREQIIEKIKSGEADLGLYIPETFNENILSGNSANWEIILGKDRFKNMAGQMILDSFIEEANRMQAVVKVLGPETLFQSQTMVNYQRPTDPSSSYVSLGRLSNDAKNYSAIQYYSSTMLVMFLLFAGLTAAISLLREKEQHTLSRLQSMPVSSFQIIGGKLLGNGLMAALQAGIILIVTSLVYGVDWGDSILYVILICVLTIFASMTLAFIVAFLFTSTKALSGVFSGFIGIMTFVSGGMSPFDGTFMEKVKIYTVNHWASDSFIQLMTSQNYSIVIQNISILASLGVLFLGVALALYRKVGYYE